MDVFLFSLLCLVAAVSSEDYYDLLGVPKDADNREIRKAFKKLALKLHPDKNKGEQDAHEKFIEINKAYEVLKDVEMRKIYDLHGAEGLKDNFGKSWKGNYHSWNYYYESFGIYDDDPEIITLTKSDFEQSILDSRDVWFVNFYSPQCSHCHLLAPAWRELARELEGVIRIGAVNCEEDWMLCRQQNVNSYPSLILYPERVKYQGSRESEAMIEYVLQQLPDNVVHLTSYNLKDLMSREEYTEQPWLIVICQDHDDCMSGDTLKKLGIILERMVNVAEAEVRADNEICKMISCSSQVTFYFNLSTLLTDKEVKSMVIEETETREIVSRVLHLLPEAMELTEESFQELKMNIESVTSAPWLILFTKRIENEPKIGIEMKRLKALLPGVLIGRFDCQKYLSTCSSLYIQKHPTFLLFKPGGTYELHHGRNTAHDISRFTREGLASQVQTLNPEHFPDIIDSGEPWFIDFFAPWCPPCMQLLPEWRKASQSAGHLIKFGTVDCTIHNAVSSIILFVPLLGSVVIQQ